MKHSNLLFIFLGGITLLLSGCASVKDAINPYEENFKCQAAKDTGECIDTPTAYKKARYPEPERDLYIEESPNIQDIQGESRESRIESHTESRIINRNLTNLTVQEQRYKTLTRLLEKPKKPLLQPPKILRVLLLPYKGENEELFMTRYVYVKIEDSKWILTDLVEK